jgi:hypothetical protein
MVWQVNCVLLTWCDKLIVCYLHGVASQLCVTYMVWQVNRVLLTWCGKLIVLLTWCGKLTVCYLHGVTSFHKNHAIKEKELS